MKILNTLLKRSIQCSLFSTLLATGSQALAMDVKCWRNDQNIRECASVVPPEHSHRRIEVVRNGRIVKVIEAAPTAEELVERERLEEERKKQEALIAERKRLDEILLKSYTTERDLIISRDNNLQSIESIIDISKGSEQVLKNSLDALNNRAANYERTGKKPPANLLKDIEDMKSQIEEKRLYVEKKEKDKAEMQAKFDADLKRFRELKGIEVPDAKPKAEAPQDSGELEKTDKPEKADRTAAEQKKAQATAK